MPGQAWMKLGGTLQIGHLAPLPASDAPKITGGAALAGRYPDEVIPVPRPWRIRTAGATLATGLTLGFSDAMASREPPPVVTPERRERSVSDRIVLYFHPQVPEATLVLIRAS